jgi:ATP-binding cassette, subfamily B, bacterial
MFKMTLKRVLKIAMHHRLLFAGNFLAIPGYVCELILAPLFLSKALQDITKHNDAQHVIRHTAIFAVMVLVGVCFNRLHAICFTRLYIRLESEINKIAVEHIYGLDEEFFADNLSGSTASSIKRYYQATTRVQETITFGWFKVIIVGIFSSVVLFQYDKILSLIVILQVMIGNYLIIRYAVNSSEIRKKLIESESYHGGTILDSISNHSLVKSSGFLNKELSHISKLVGITYDWQKKYCNRAIKAYAIIQGVSAFLQVSVLSYCIWAVYSGRFGIDIFVLTQVYAFRIIANFANTRDAVTNIETAVSDTFALETTLQTKAKVVDNLGVKDLIPGLASITIKNLTVKYGRAKALDGLDLVVKPGERVGIIGASGGGKSTLTKVLMRMIDPTSGNVLFGDQDIKNVTIQSIRRSIAYVPQDPLMLHRSIFDNIAFMTESASLDQVRAAAKAAHIDEYVDSLPDGYDTLVGERGIKLSGGQRQRVALARAILADRPYLLLDEATSALDNESEELITRSLNTLMKGRTSLVIAHRLSTIKHLDRIVVLEKGMITESGTHDELLAKKGRYFQLWSKHVDGYLV